MGESIGRIEDDVASTSISANEELIHVHYISVYSLDETWRLWVKVGLPEELSQFILLALCKQ